ncbi:MAG: peptidoglycan hydrolase-like protein with peptidoglycan-binding domain, partial [Planctomycetota bacterium]
DVTGTQPIPNSIGISTGPSLIGVPQIGGVGAGEGNIIAHALNEGINNTRTATIIGNNIYSNGTLGIDNEGDGVSVNDIGDGDEGANDLLNYPLINSVQYSGNVATVAYVLDVPAGDYRVEFFENPDGVDTNGYGEGQLFVGSDTVTHAGFGEQFYSSTYVGTPSGQYLTMTATEDTSGGAGTSFGPTSEFGIGSALPVVTTGGGTSPGNIRTTTSSTSRKITIRKAISDDDKITVTYPENLNTSQVPNISDWQVRSNGQIVAVVGVSVLGNRVYLQLSESMLDNTDVRLDYSAGEPRLESDTNIPAATETNVPVQSKQSLIDILLGILFNKDVPTEGGSCSSVVDLSISDADYALFSSLPDVQIMRTTAENLSPSSALFDRGVTLQSQVAIQSHINAMPEQAKDVLCARVPTSIYRRGSKGSDVGWLQRALNYGVCTDLYNDESYGRRTMRTVQEFQKRYGIPADGNWGPQTAATMRSVLGCGQ